MCDDLLPCPFCGGEAEIDEGYGYLPYKHIACKQCYAKTMDADTWNTRAEAQAVDVEALKRKLPDECEEKDYFWQCHGYNQAIDDLHSRNLIRGVKGDVYNGNY